VKRLLLTFLVVGGCTCELGDTPPSTDTPPPTCGRLAVPTCWDDCCTFAQSPDIDPSTCDATCRGDTRPFFDACEPEPWCRDGSVPDLSSCEEPDAGPIGGCFGGVCCDVMSAARFDPVTCSYECPEGSSFDCRPDPAACSDDLRICSEPSECIVTTNTCCGECGEATLEGSTAVNAESASAFRERLCVDTIDCDACEGSTNASIVATCNAARCAAVEISRLPMAACTADDDCVVRTRDCCECGGATDRSSLIALRPDGLIDYLGLVCDTDAICDDCVPPSPDGVEAACIDGVCEVVDVPDSDG
jgi:hypothetical protein